MGKYLICFIAKVMLGSFAIANYSMCKDAKSAELTIFCALLSIVATFGCMAITVWQCA